MRKDEFKQRKEKAFRRYCLKIIDTSIKDYWRTEKRKAKRVQLVSLDILTDEQMFQSLDTYNSLPDVIFDVWGCEVVVKDRDYLVETLSALTERERNIVLASIYLGYTDLEISKKISLARRTVAYQRIRILEKMKKIILEERKNEK